MTKSTPTPSAAATEGDGFMSTFIGLTTGTAFGIREPETAFAPSHSPGSFADLYGAPTGPTWVATSGSTTDRLHWATIETGPNPGGDPEVWVTLPGGLPGSISTHSSSAEAMREIARLRAEIAEAYSLGEWTYADEQTPFDVRPL